MLARMAEYRSLRGVGLATVVLLCLNVASVLVTIPSSLAQLGLADRLETGDYDDAELDANDTRAIGIVAFSLYIATAIVFAIWFHRAYTNLRAFGHETRHGTGWAIGGWIVPILSLFRPYQITREIWWTSAPSAEAGTELPSGPPVLVAWWAAWITNGVLGQIVFRTSMNVNTPSALKVATNLQMGSDVVMLVTAVLAVIIVRTITRRQEERAAAGAGLSDTEIAALERTFD